MKSLSSKAVVLLATIFYALTSSNTQAQSITLTSPTSPNSVKEGDDFATTQLSNPWDFNQRRDIGWEENFSGASISATNGVWSGTNQVPGGYVFPLFPGFKGGLFPDVLQGDSSLPAMGIHNKIDASRYTQLCYRGRHSSRSTLAVYWSNDESRPQYWPDGSNNGASYDGFYSPYAIPNSGWQVYCFDMTHLSTSFDQSGGSWSGNIFGLRLDPSISGPVGSTTEIDWVRLVDPNSAPSTTISWSSSGVSGQVFTLYYDTDNSGFDGTPFKRFVNGANPGTYTFSTAVLPPGTYYFYVTAQAAGVGVMVGSVTRSAYSAAVTVNSAPAATFSSPSQTSGTEYAATEVGNAWDMDSATDVPNVNRANYADSFRQFSNDSFAPFAGAEDAGMIFQAQANPPLPGNTEGDDQVHLNVSSAHPIDPGKYRYLVYRIAADESNFPTLNDKVSQGWVTRPVWWNEDVIADGGDPGAHVLYEGWHTYAEDLWTVPIERGIAWTANSRLKHLRVDPLETSILTWFYLDYVRLYAENRTSNNQFTISFNIADSDSSTFTASLYYDTNASGFDGTLITTLNGLSAGSHSYVWNTSGLTEGAKYNVYVVLSDGVNTSKFYAPVHVVVGDYTPTPIPRGANGVQWDFDADGKSDLAFVRPGITTLVATKSATRKRKPKPKPKPKPKTPVTTPTFSHVLLSGSNTDAQNMHSNPSARLVSMDLNGDHISDVITVTDNGVNLVWEGYQSRSATAYNRTFGVTGDLPIKGDFNGNGREEIAVFRSGQWYILDESDQVLLSNWGTVGDLPVPADYDGDGTTDLAIFRPSTGEWWILNSGFALGYAKNYYTSFSYGLSGDIPVQGDYDGDGRDDAAVFRPAEGLWYIRYAVDGSAAVFQWGIAGDIPVARLDPTGSGKAALTVYRPSNGTWYQNANSQVIVKAFGSSTDYLPVTR